MKDRVLDIGHVTGLDYKNPTTDPHNELQRMKEHPEIRKMLDGAKLIRYGAKAIPEGGLFAMIKPYSVTGSMITGDSAGFLNGMRLKGVHLAMKSGMMAADTAWDALQAQEVRQPNSSRSTSSASAIHGRTKSCAARATSTKVSSTACGPVCSTPVSQPILADALSASSTSSRRSRATKIWRRPGIARKKRRAQRSTTC